MSNDQTQGDQSVLDRLNSYHSSLAGEVEPQSAPPTENKEPVQEVASPIPDVASQEEEEALQNSKNPERTRAYIEKLKKERDEALKLQSPEGKQSDDVSSVLESIRSESQRPTDTQDARVLTPHLNQQQVSVITDQYIDSEGNVDIQGLNLALKSANERAKSADERVTSLEKRITSILETQEVKETHAVFPQLDPKSDQFNKAFFELTRDRLMKNQAYNIGESFLQAASFVAKAIGVNTSPPPATKTAEERANIDAALKKQAPYEQGREKVNEDVSITDLVQRSRGRRGRDADIAISERLKRIGV